MRGNLRRLALRNPAGEASGGRDQSAGYARRSHSYAVTDVGSIPTVSINGLIAGGTQLFQLDARRLRLDTSQLPRPQLVSGGLAFLGSSSAVSFAPLPGMWLATHRLTCRVGKSPGSFRSLRAC